MNRIAFIGAMVICAGLLAQPAGQPPPRIDARNIEMFLNSPIPAIRQSAVDAVAQLATAQPDSLAKEFRSWVKPLMDDQEYDLVESAGLVALVHRPQNPMDVSNIQAARVQALLAQSKYEPALVEAKRYYDVATLKQTPTAIDLLAEALEGARGKTNHGIGIRLRKQQLAGAKMPDRSQLPDWAAKGPAAWLAPPTPPSTPATPVDSILASIQVDGSAFDNAIARKQGADGYDDLMAEGNLLLLAGRASEAKACFRKLAERETTRGKNLAAALEGIARAIRAEDGSVGRANAFILALKEQK